MTINAMKLIEAATRPGVDIRKLVEDSYPADAPMGAQPLPAPFQGAPTNMGTQDEDNPLPSANSPLPTPSPMSPSDGPAANFTSLAQYIATSMKGTVSEVDDQGQIACVTIDVGDDGAVCFKLVRDHSGDTVVDKVRWQQPRPDEDHQQFRHDDHKSLEAMAKSIGDFLNSTG
jgi:hypothetical protein